VLDDEIGGTTWCSKSHLADRNFPWTRKLCFEYRGEKVDFRRRIGCLYYVLSPCGWQLVTLLL
jgi:hypothetical protein